MSSLTEIAGRKAAGPNKTGGMRGTYITRGQCDASKTTNRPEQFLKTLLGTNSEDSV
ncbi:MAG TPA: hypothetical protein VF074_04155 [Pyrinomonadaceae bacterium]